MTVIDSVVAAIPANVSTHGNGQADERTVSSGDDTHLALVTRVHGVGLVAIVSSEDVDKIAVHARNHSVETEEVVQRALAALPAGEHVGARAAV